MLFGSKGNKNINETKIAECIGRFFELPTPSVKSWIKVEKDGVKVTLPFAAKSLHQDLLKQIKLSTQNETLTISIDTQITSVPTKIAQIPN